jgi:diguanylate cyclase (GGDEF)-like protein
VQALLKQRKLSLESIRNRATIHELTEQLASKKQSLHTQQHYLDILAERDGLTGLYNRKQLSNILQREFQKAVEFGTDLSLLIMDINDFRETNRKLGHLFGDFILNEIAARLTSNTRDSDLCFRFSGGNFIILLPQSNISHARQAAKKLIGCCSEKPFNNGQIVEHISISIGISSVCDSNPETPEQLINMADTSMSQSQADKSSPQL